MITADDRARFLELCYEVERRNLSKSFAEFAKESWHILEPETPLKWNWHHDYICEHLEQLRSGHIKRLIVEVPPRSMKSILISVCYPAWIWASDPGHRFIKGSYSGGLSMKHSVDCRQILDSEWYRNLFGHQFQLPKYTNKVEFSNDKRGHMIATSMRGTATGKGCNTLIIDDPHNVDEAYSKHQREQTIQAFRNKFFTRLDDKKNGRIAVVMQRIHLMDLVGSLTDQGGWTIIKLQAIEEQGRVFLFPKSKRVVERPVGDILQPDREGIEELDQLKRDLGSRNFMAQYQQNPSSESGGLVKRSDIQYFKVLPKVINDWIQSWDFTFKDTDNSNYVVGQVWARCGPNMYLVDQIRDKLDFSASCRAMLNLTAKWPKAILKLVEDKGNGPAIISAMKNQVSGLVEFNPNQYGSKEARLAAVSPHFEGHNIHIPEGADWAQDWVEELVTFPNGANDDQVDATTQALIKLNKSNRTSLTRLVKW